MPSIKTNWPIYEHKGGVPVLIVSVPVHELENRYQIKPYFGTGPKVTLNLGPVPKQCLICMTSPKVEDWYPIFLCLLAWWSAKILMEGRMYNFSMPR